jgi:hypothetical protein
MKATVVLKKSEHRCPRCETVKPYTSEHFYTNTTNTYCKPCQTAATKYRKAALKNGTLNRKRPLRDFKSRNANRAARDAQMLAIGEEVTRKCPKAHFAVDVITAGWWALKEGKA